jgi:hypothetical protein
MVAGTTTINPPRSKLYKKLAKEGVMAILSLKIGKNSFS